MGVAGLRSSVSLSVFAHLLFIGIWLYVSDHRTASPRKAPLWVEIETSKDQPLKPQEKKLLDDANSKRIVQTQITKKSEKAAPDAFAGQQTQIVERQTVSQTQITNAGQSNRLAKANKTEKAEPKKQTQPKEKVLAEKSLAARELSKLGLPIIPKAEKFTDASPASPEDDRVYPMPSSDGIPQDYIKGLKRSETTALNTKEYVFFGYFQRIRQKLDRAWGSTLKEQLFKFYRQGRRLASEMDHTTRIMVTLNSIGEVVQVQVMEESGTRDLDDAAVKAFNRAGPFPNPPRGILDGTGKIQIRWDFVLKT